MTAKRAKKTDKRDFWDKRSKIVRQSGKKGTKKTLIFCSIFSLSCLSFLSCLSLSRLSFLSCLSLSFLSSSHLSFLFLSRLSLSRLSYLFLSFLSSSCLSFFCIVCPLSVVSPLAPDTNPQFEIPISTCYSRYCVYSLYNSFSHALPCTVYPCPLAYSSLSLP